MVAEFLLEETEVITQTDTVAVEVQRSDGIQETRGETSKSAVSEGRFRFKLLNFLEILAVGLQELQRLLI